MVSEREIEAAIKAIEAVPIMGDTYSLSGEDAKAAARAALEAAALARAEANAEPAAWRYKLFEGDPEWTVTTEKPKGVVVEPLFTRPSEQAVTEADKSDDAVAELFLAAWAEADKAMRKFPQPNYVISKVAEEAGEVVKAAIHCAEGRETPENVVAEIKQAMAMLIRLYVEGDQVHGLPALKAQEDEK